MDSKLRVSEISASPTRATASQVPVGTWPKALLGDLLGTVLPALLIVVGIITFIVQPTSVDGSSMEPSLHTGQRLVIEKVSYHFRGPAEGDVVVLKLPGREATPLIKRVVANPGDQIAIRNGLFYLNGKALSEPYLSQITVGDVPPTLVPEGYVYVLGDNRSHSNDSRTFGMVHVDQLVGRAVASYWPAETLGPVR